MPSGRLVFAMGLIAEGAHGAARGEIIGVICPGVPLEVLAVQLAAAARLPRRKGNPGSEIEVVNTLWRRGSAGVLPAFEAAGNLAGAAVRGTDFGQPERGPGRDQHRRRQSHLRPHR